MRPVLHALDRMERREVLAPEAVQRHAHELLAERFGPSDSEAGGAFARGGTGLLGEQTHYAAGFAVLLPLEQGTAVAARRAEAGAASRVVFKGEDAVHTFDARQEHVRREHVRQEAPVWVRIVTDIARQFAPAGAPVEVAVASTVPAACRDAYLAALGVAAARAMRRLARGETTARGETVAPPPPDPAPDGQEHVQDAPHVQDARERPDAYEADALVEAVRERLEACTGLPFSVAYPLAARVGRPGRYLLVDTATREALAVRAPEADVLGWGLIDVGRALPREAAFHRRRQGMAAEALAQLSAAGFHVEAGFRDIEHRDLGRALNAVEADLQPVVRHLVGENRRVQRLVAAVRRADWQMFGALLLMSHASLRDLWGSTSEALDFVVRQAEALSADGIYGACMTGRGSCVLVAGHPFVVPRALDQMAAAFEAEFGRAPATLLL